MRRRATVYVIPVQGGFQVEGRLRDYHRNDDGTYRDMWLMSILRRDWAKRHRL